MPIKELEFTFSLDVEDLAALLAHRNTGMKIQVKGTEALPIEAPQSPALLPPPSFGGVRKAIMQYMHEHPGEAVPIATLRAITMQLGYSDKSAINVVYNLKVAGLIKNAGFAKYRITAKGARSNG